MTSTSRSSAPGGRSRRSRRCCSWSTRATSASSPRSARRTTEAPTIYLYEAVPGGVGLSERLWAPPRRARRRAAELIAACACEAGCPGLHRAAPGARGRREGARAAAAGELGRRREAARGLTAVAATTSRSRRRVPAAGDAVRAERGSRAERVRRRAAPRPARRRGLAERLAAALDGEVVTTPRGASSGSRRRPTILPLDRERLARAARPTAGRTRRCSASTRRRPASRPRPARSRSSSGLAGGRGAGSGRSSSSCRITPTSPRCSRRWRRTSRRTAGS